MSDAAMSANLAGGTAAAGFYLTLESEVYSLAFLFISLAFVVLAFKQIRARRAAE